MTPESLAPSPGVYPGSQGRPNRVRHSDGFDGIFDGALCAPRYLGAVCFRQDDSYPPNPQTTMPAAIMCGLIAVVLIWLGIGSILARRWARALLLILSWTWLAMGVVALIYLAFLLPQIMATIDSTRRPGQAEIPQGIKTTIMVVQGIFALVM